MNEVLSTVPCRPGKSCDVAWRRGGASRCQRCGGRIAAGRSLSTSLDERDIHGGWLRACQRSIPASVHV